MMKLSLFFLSITIAGCTFQETETADWIEVRGTLTKQSHGKTSTTEFEYEYNGKKYNGPSSGRASITSYKTVLGESYMLKVNPQKPEQYIILPWRTGFNAGEDIDSCVGKIIKVGEAKPFGHIMRLLEYEYVAYGKTYLRRQRIAPDDTLYFPKLKDGQCFTVIFWRPNPQRAVMFFKRAEVKCD